jgi:DNA repair ATPase RecN
MNQLWEDLKEAEGAVKDKNNVTEDEQKAIDEVNERIEAVKSAIELYDTTKEELEDMDNEIADALLSIQQHNFELLTLELEMKITVNDADLKVLDYYLSKISDDIYGMAESFTLMYGAMDDSGKWNSANS